MPSTYILPKHLVAVVYTAKTSGGKHGSYLPPKKLLLSLSRSTTPCHATPTPRLSSPVLRCCVQPHHSMSVSAFCSAVPRLAVPSAAVHPHHSTSVSVFCFVFYTWCPGTMWHWSYAWPFCTSAVLQYPVAISGVSCLLCLALWCPHTSPHSAMSVCPILTCSALVVVLFTALATCLWTFLCSLHTFYDSLSNCGATLILFYHCYQVFSAPNAANLVWTVFVLFLLLSLFHQPILCVCEVFCGTMCFYMGHVMCKMAPAALWSHPFHAFLPSLHASSLLTGRWLVTSRHLLGAACWLVVGTHHLLFTSLIGCPAQGRPMSLALSHHCLTRRHPPHFIVWISNLPVLLCIHFFVISIHYEGSEGWLSNMTVWLLFCCWLPVHRGSGWLKLLHSFASWLQSRPEIQRQTHTSALSLFPAIPLYHLTSKDTSYKSLSL